MDGAARALSLARGAGSSVAVDSNKLARKLSLHQHEEVFLHTLGKGKPQIYAHLARKPRESLLALRHPCGSTGGLIARKTSL